MALPAMQITSNPLPVGMAQRNGRDRNPPSTEDRIDTLHFDMVGGSPIGLYGVYDGHSGTNVSEYAKEHLLKKIQSAIQNGQPVLTTDRISQILQSVFVEFDMELYRNYTSSLNTSAPIQDSGSCATVAVVTSNDVIVGHIGDSPCILLNKTSGLLQGGEIKAHWPSLGNTEEINRIVADGMKIRQATQTEPARVNGSLMISRAFGDFYLKKNIGKKDSKDLGVTPYPTITVWKRKPGQILALCSDGLTEQGATGMDLAKKFAEAVREKPDLNAAALAALPSNHKGDDVSLILVDVSVAQSGGRRSRRYTRHRRVRKYKRRSKKKVHSS